MRCLATGMLMLAAAGCSAPDAETRKAEATVVSAAVAFDGADYKDQAAKTVHGKRLATLFGCNGCHGADYSGRDFGAAIPIVKGLWASNISRAMPAMSDAALERLLREGVHPDREIYVMPSKQTQFLSERDMAALIAFLRTIPPVGETTPVPPAGFEAAVTARLPDDYWLTLQERGEARLSQRRRGGGLFRRAPATRLGAAIGTRAHDRLEPLQQLSRCCARRTG